MSYFGRFAKIIFELKSDGGINIHSNPAPGVSISGFIWERNKAKLSQLLNLGDEKQILIVSGCNWFFTGLSQRFGKGKHRTTGNIIFRENFKQLATIALLIRLLQKSAIAFQKCWASCNFYEEQKQTNKKKTIQS